MVVIIIVYMHKIGKFGWHFLLRSKNCFFCQLGFSSKIEVPSLAWLGTFIARACLNRKIPARTHLYQLDKNQRYISILYQLGKSSILMFMDIRLCYCLREKIHYQRRQRFMLGEETEKANDEIPWAYLNEKREKEKRSWCMISHIYIR